jgi:hypothetical protein
MLSQILDARDLQSAAENLRIALRKHAYRQQKVVWGTPSGRRDEFETYVLRAKSHDIYVGIHNDGPRQGTYAHLFRLVEHNAEATPNFAPNAEINVSKTGRNSAGGLFAMENGRIVLCRRATFSAYRRKLKEVDALAFFGSYAVPVRSGRKEFKALPVAALDSPTFIRDLEEFVQQAIALKENFNTAAPATGNGASAGTDNAENRWPWHDSEEFEGIKTVDARGAVSYEYLHGPLCNRLSVTLEAWAKQRYLVRRTQNIDTAIVGADGFAKVIFEVKTSGSLSDQLYKAIGQLFHYRWKRGDEDTILCLVLPGEVACDAKRATAFLTTRGIHVFYETAPGEYSLADGVTLGAFLDVNLQ